MPSFPCTGFFFPGWLSDWPRGNNPRTAHTRQHDRATFKLDLLSEEDQEWARAESLGQPWPTLLKEDIDFETLIKPYFPDGRIGPPTYLLGDREGKLIARGKAAALAAASKAD